MLNEQKNAVDELIARLGTVEAVASYLGVSTDSVTHWRNRKVAAKGLARRKLLQALEDTAEMESESAAPQSGRHFSKKTRRNIETELKKLELAPPSVRAATLRELLTISGFSIAALARELKIHENTLKYYLDPECEILMTLDTARKIYEFSENLKGKPVSEVSLQARLENALRKLLGDKILKNGFYDRDIRRAIAAGKISANTNLHERTIRRYFPPLKNRRFPPAVVEAFEKAAEELGNIIDSH